MTAALEAPRPLRSSAHLVRAVQRVASDAVLRDTRSNIAPEELRLAFAAHNDLGTVGALREGM